MTIKIRRRALLCGAAASGLLATLPLPVRSNGRNFDVVVVGSGAGGFTAAIRAAESGARTALLEANSWTGGASRVATGIFGCAGHPIQKALGFTTTPDDLYKVYVSVAAATNTRADEKVARILADGAIPAADWLAELGVKWSTTRAQKFFLNIMEGHRLGEFLIDSLESKAKSEGVEIFTRTRAVKLARLGETGFSVICETPSGDVSFQSGAVVLATGGFEANPEMIGKYVGNGWEKAAVYCTPTNRGDGQRMAAEIGAALSDMEVFKANPTVHVSQGNRWNLIGAVRAGAIAVNQKGERFFNETGGYIQSLKIWALPERSCWLVFGEPVVKSVPRIPGLIAAGTVIQADSAGELAKATGMDAVKLEQTVSRFRAFAASGKDEDFKRGSLKDGFGGKFFAAKIEPMVQGTFGGVKTNEETEALDADGKVVPGLYAVGECASHGLRGVNPQTANIVFGSIAGRRAAKFSTNGRKGE